MLEFLHLYGFTLYHLDSATRTIEIINPFTSDQSYIEGFLNKANTYTDELVMSKREEIGSIAILIIVSADVVILLSSSISFLAQSINEQQFLLRLRFCTVLTAAFFFFIMHYSIFISLRLLLGFNSSFFLNTISSIPFLYVDLIVLMSAT